MTVARVRCGLRSMAAVRSSARSHAFFALISVAAVAQDHPYGLQEDLDVEPGRPVAQVFEVVAYALRHLLQGLGLAPEAVDLRQSRDPGPHFVADHVAIDQLAVQLVVDDGMRPRPHQAHLALKHIEELRQLIERGLAQERADAGHPRIALARLRHHGAIFAHSHGAEFVDQYLLAIQSIPPLPEERRATGAQAY